MNEILSMATREPGRNELCPCGSGRKYKRCHLDDVASLKSTLAHRRRVNDNGHTSIVISCDPTQGPKRKKGRIHRKPGEAAALAATASLFSHRPSAPAPTGSFSRSSSRLSAQSNRDGVAGWALPPRPFGFTGSSAMNSAQENSDCCGSGASSSW